MSCARTQLRSTIDEAREAVWNLRQKPAAVRSLGPFLRSMAEQVYREFGIPVEYQVTGEAFEFPRDTIHEVLMAMREAIYNAVRHAHPRRVRILVGFKGDECQLRVVDDGIGFKVGTPPARGLGHYGLVGIQERVQRIGGRFVVNSKEGAGTEVVIYVPRRGSVMRESDEVPTVL